MFIYWQGAGKGDRKGKGEGKGKEDNSARLANFCCATYAFWGSCTKHNEGKCGYGHTAELKEAYKKNEARYKLDLEKATAMKAADAKQWDVSKLSDELRNKKL